MKRGSPEEKLTFAGIYEKGTQRGDLRKSLAAFKLAGLHHSLIILADILLILRRKLYHPKGSVVLFSEPDYLPETDTTPSSVSFDLFSQVQ